MRPVPRLVLLVLAATFPLASAGPTPSPQPVDLDGFPTTRTLDVPLPGASIVTLHAHATDTILGPTELARIVDAEDALVLRVWEDNYDVYVTDGAGATLLTSMQRPTWHALTLAPTAGGYVVTLDELPPRGVDAVSDGAPARLTALPGASGVLFADVRIDDPADHANRFSTPLAAKPGWSVGGAADMVNVYDGADGATDPGVLQVRGTRTEGSTAYVAYTPPQPLAAFEARVHFRAMATDGLNSPAGHSVLACRDEAGGILWSLDTLPTGVGYHVALIQGEDVSLASPVYISTLWHAMDVTRTGGALAVSFDEAAPIAFDGMPDAACASLALGDLRTDIVLGGIGVIRFDGVELRLG